MIIFNSLENCSTEQLTYAFNRAFEGYEIPLRFEVVDFERKLKVENFSPKHSVGAFNQKGELVGFIIHCVADDAKKLYNAGTGVFAEYRGEKLTKKMYEFGLENSLFNGMTEIILEVLVNNQPAYKSYLNVDFEFKRNFNSYKGFPNIMNLKHPIEKVELTHDLLSKFQQIARTQPSWQNNFQTMQLSKDFLEVYVAKIDSIEVGYILFNPLSKRIHQIAVLQEFTNQGIATSLLSQLYKNHPCTYTIINVDANDSTLNNWLQNNGFENFVSLDELVLAL